METYTREEQYWAAMAGEQDAPTPVTRMEQLQKKVAEKISGGGGGETTTVKIINVMQQNRIDPGLYGTASGWLNPETNKVKRIIGWCYQKTNETRPGYIIPKMDANITFVFPTMDNTGKYIENITVGLHNLSTVDMLGDGYICFVCECDA